MHDVTEGGLATALEELSVAGRHRLRVYRDRIAVLEEARQVCSVFAVDPLGLIGSGSLLITCAQEKSDNLICAIREAGVQAAAIGEVLEQGAGIEAVSVPGGTQVDWPHFEVDEIARIFAQFPPTRTS
jgi:hydrogenase expression/formation protein HypE